MSLLEIFATALTVICVLLAVKRNVWTYPIGIAGTISFFFVFWQADLFASAWLQVFFTAVQIYGWWFWLKGDRGSKPRISTWPVAWFAGFIAAALVAAVLMSTITSQFGAKMALLDSGIFTMSVVAQFFMDRKKLESWIVWALVNVVSIFVYGSQGLTVTAWLYGALLLNTAWGYYEWRKELNSYAQGGEVK